jgi:hypothetical protein
MVHVETHTHSHSYTPLDLFLFSVGFGYLNHTRPDHTRPIHNLQTLPSTIYWLIMDHSMDPERATPSSTPRKFSIRSNFGKARQPRSRKNRPCDACRRRKTACVITAEPPCETRPISIHPSIQSIQFPAHYRTIGSISSSLTLNKAIYTYTYTTFFYFTLLTLLYCTVN